MPTPVALEHHPPVSASVWPLTSQIVLGACPSAAPCARSYLTETLVWWGMARFTCDALAVTSELVTNAIKASWAHSCATVAVWLWADDRQLLIEVWDSAPGVPSPV